MKSWENTLLYVMASALTGTCAGVILMLVVGSASGISAYFPLLGILVGGFVGLAVSLLKRKLRKK
jgi:hypothetical protein